MDDKTLQRKLNQMVRLGNELDTVCSALSALEEIREIYAGMDGFIPKTAPEAYQERIIRQMYASAINGINSRPRL